MGTAIKHPLPDWVKPVICNFCHPDTLTLSRARMSKIINDGSTQSGTGCFIAVPIWQQWTSKGISNPTHMVLHQPIAHSHVHVHTHCICFDFYTLT